MPAQDEKQGENKGDDRVRQYAEAVAQALINGRPVSDIIDEMEHQGWKREDAREFVGKIQYASRQAQRMAQMKKTFGPSLLLHAVLGAIWVVLGVLCFVASNPTRDMRGIGIAIGTFGIFEFAWALVNWKRTRK